MIGPGVFTGAFALGVRSKSPEVFAGAPYFIAAFLMLVAFVIAARAGRGERLALTR